MEIDGARSEGPAKAPEDGEVIAFDIDLQEVDMVDAPLLEVVVPAGDVYFDRFADTGVARRDERVQRRVACVEIECSSTRLGTKRVTIHNECGSRQRTVERVPLPVDRVQGSSARQHPDGRRAQRPSTRHCASPRQSSTVGREHIRWISRASPFVARLWFTFS